MSKPYNTIVFDTKRFTKKIVLSNIKITPDLAAEILQHNMNNRPVSSKVVKEYAQHMKKGKWEFNGDTIRFSHTAKLLDGQHRLMAVQQSGTTQVFNIQSGLDDEVFDVIDIGKSRTAGDAVAVAGYENYTILASAIKLIMAYASNQLKAQSMGTGGSRAKYSNADVIDFLNKLSNEKRDLLQECCKQAGKWQYAGKFYSAPTYAAFAYIFSGFDRDQSFFFFDLLTSGENISKNNCSMIYLLRQKLINTQMTNKRLQTVDKYALMIKSWNFYRKAKEISQLSWQPTEEFPNAQ